MCGSHLQELNVALVDDRQMSALHKQFMGISGPTDVLSFSLEHDSAKEVTAGEIAICIPFARRQARRLGTAAGKEVLLYALHGLLHLSGWDDRTAAQYQRMHRMEDAILCRLGVGPVFLPRPLKGRR
jgi:probable rRNA maturation factor